MWLKYFAETPCLVDIEKKVHLDTAFL